MLNIKVIGTGCPNCLRLKALCDEVVKEQNFNAKIESVTDINTFGDCGIFMTPGLVVNGSPLSQGKIPTKSTLIHWLKNSLNQ